MTINETKMILAILKAAYPNFYKDMGKQQATATVNIWATQFADMPAKAVIIAVQKLISTSTFPPSISEVKEKIRSMYWEAKQMLFNHQQAIEGVRLTDNPYEEPMYFGEPLDENILTAVNEILAICEPMRTQQRIEPSLSSLLSNYNSYLAGADTKQLKE